jgi:hypothetical protein
LLKKHKQQKKKISFGGYQKVNISIGGYMKENNNDVMGITA